MLQNKGKNKRTKTTGNSQEDPSVFFFKLFFIVQHASTYHLLQGIIDATTGCVVTVTERKQLSHILAVPVMWHSFDLATTRVRRDDVLVVVAV